MPSSVKLGDKLESIVDDLVKKGRYNSRSEVLRAGVRIIQERELKLAELEASIERAIEDSETGRVRDLDDVLAEIDAEFDAMEQVRRSA